MTVLFRLLTMIAMLGVGFPAVRGNAHAEMAASGAAKTKSTAKNSDWNLFGNRRPATRVPPRNAAAPAQDKIDDTVRRSGSEDLRSMIGQMIMVGFRGTTPRNKWVQTMRRQIRSGRLGGVLLVGANITSPVQLRALTDYFLAGGSAAGGLPFIAVDQEGGQVQRLTRANGFAMSYPSAQALAASGPAEARRIYRLLADELARAGINVNLGPVVDLNSNPANPIIGAIGRSYAPGATRVSQFGEIFVEAHHARNILIALKHFPGHGSSRADSHKGFVDVSDTWRSSELEPYRTLLRRFGASIDMVMTAHLFNRTWTTNGRDPFTLAAGSVDRMLRRDLGYNGVVITDDLEMGAIRKNYPLHEAVVKAINAGNDILLFSNTAEPDPQLPEKVAEIIMAAIDKGIIDRARIAQSFGRIMRLKQKLRASNRRTARPVPAPLLKTK